MAPNQDHCPLDPFRFPVVEKSPAPIVLPADQNQPSPDIEAREQAERNWARSREWLKAIDKVQFQHFVSQIVNEHYKHMGPYSRRAFYCLAMNAILELTARVKEDAEREAQGAPVQEALEELGVKYSFEQE